MSAGLPPHDRSHSAASSRLLETPRPSGGLLSCLLRRVPPFSLLEPTDPQSFRLLETYCDYCNNAYYKWQHLEILNQRPSRCLSICGERMFRHRRPTSSKMVPCC